MAKKDSEQKRVLNLDGKEYVIEDMTNDQKANMYDFISNFEDAKKKKKVVKPKKTTSLEYFMT